MSARTSLTETLATALAVEAFDVKEAAPTPSTQIPPAKAYVHVERAGLVPSPATSGWAQALVVLVLVGAEVYHTAEAALDELLPPVVAAIEAASYPVVTVDRDTFFERFHGYRITTTITTPTP